MFTHLEFEMTGDIELPYFIAVHDNEWTEPFRVKAMDKTYLSCFVALIKAYENNPLLAPNIAKWFIGISRKMTRIQIEGAAEFMKKVYPEMDYENRFHKSIVEQINKFENLK